MCSFSFEMFSIKILRILKMFKYNMEFIRATSWINSKISNKDKNTTLMIVLFCNYCWSLLWCNYWRSLILWNSTSWSRLKLTVQMQLALYLCDPFSINNHNVAGNSVEKCFVVLNVKLEVKLRFKTFYWLQNLLSTAFAFNITTKPACFARHFCIT